MKLQTILTICILALLGGLLKAEPLPFKLEWDESMEQVENKLTAYIDSTGDKFKFKSLKDSQVDKKYRELANLQIPESHKRIELENVLFMHKSTEKVYLNFNENGKLNSMHFLFQWQKASWKKIEKIHWTFFKTQFRSFEKIYGNPITELDDLFIFTQGNDITDGTIFNSIWIDNQESKISLSISGKSIKNLNSRKIVHSVLVTYKKSKIIEKLSSTNSDNYQSGQPLPFNLNWDESIDQVENNLKYYIGQTGDEIKFNKLKEIKNDYELSYFRKLIVPENHTRIEIEEYKILSKKPEKTFLVFNENNQLYSIQFLMKWKVPKGYESWNRHWKFHKSTLFSLKTKYGNPITGLKDFYMHTRGKDIVNGSISEIVWEDSLKSKISLSITGYSIEKNHKTNQFHDIFIVYEKLDSMNRNNVLYDNPLPFNLHWDDNLEQVVSKLTDYRDPTRIELDFKILKNSKINKKFRKFSELRIPENYKRIEIKNIKKTNKSAEKVYLNFDENEKLFSIQYLFQWQKAKWKKIDRSHWKFHRANYRSFEKLYGSPITNLDDFYMYERGKDITDGTIFEIVWESFHRTKISLSITGTINRKGTNKGVLHTVFIVYEKLRSKSEVSENEN